MLSFGHRFPDNSSNDPSVSHFQSKMRRIALTQRVETFYGGTERRDCLDQRWTALLQSLGFVPLPLPNTLRDPAQYLSWLGIDGVVLSGGNDLSGISDSESAATERDATERAIILHSLEHRLPLLGVCRGMQAINFFLGGKVAMVSRHAGTRHRVHGQPGSERYWPRQFEVNSFHDFGIFLEGLAPELDAGSTCDQDGTVEAFHHRHANCFGVMWHPEREAPPAEYDRELIRRLFAA